MKLKFKVLFGTVSILASMVVSTFGASATNPLHDVVNTGNVERIEELCKLNGDWIHRKNEYGDLPIHCATTFGALKCLIKNGADVNAQGSGGRTVLHRFMIYAANSADREYADAINYLLKNGADINIRDGKNMTPLDLLESLYRHHLERDAHSDTTLRLKMYIESLREPDGKICI
ncbi:MAG: ankyrin repeat domain-containing protein [Clostridia bacterium]|nr:ankyrin repeat domain-containing protein [Clostridia bacterium]